MRSAKVGALEPLCWLKFVRQILVREGSAVRAFVSHQPLIAAASPATSPCFAWLLWAPGWSLLNVEMPLWSALPLF